MTNSPDAALALARCPACWRAIQHLPGAPVLWGDLCTAPIQCAACAAAFPAGARLLQCHGEWQGARRNLGVVVEPGGVRVFTGAQDQPRTVARREVLEVAVFGSPGPWSTVLHVRAARIVLPADARRSLGVRLITHDILESGLVLGDGGWGTPERLEAALRATLDTPPAHSPPPVSEAACRCPRCGYPMRGCTVPLAEWWAPLDEEIYCTECGLRAPKGAYIVPQRPTSGASAGRLSRVSVFRGIPPLIIGLGLGLLYFRGIIPSRYTVLPVVLLCAVLFVRSLVRRAAAKAGGPPPNGAWIIQPGALRVANKGSQEERAFGAGGIHSFQVHVVGRPGSAARSLSAHSPSGRILAGASPIMIHASSDLNMPAVLVAMRSVLLQPSASAELSPDA